MPESVVYQFPLNESMRTYLRIEQLFQRCLQAMDYESEPAGLSYFNGLFDLLELLERTDVRQDLLKDLELQQKEIERWALYPNIDLVALKQLDETIQQCSIALRSQLRLANCLKDDKFLTSIRQRFSIPGGNCCFDVPQLYHWLHQESTRKRQDMHNWLSQLDVLQTAIGLLMQLLRDGKLFKPLIARSGFYQANAEGLQILRIACDSDLGVFPTVSGNKHRFSIRFLSASDCGVTHDVPFKLSTS